VAVLIDTPVWPWRGRLWSHLVSDVSYEDLYEIAVAAGAEPVGGRELLSRLQGAGLRLKKPRDA
jgi:hypothetical protein